MLHYDCDHHHLPSDQMSRGAVMYFLICVLSEKNPNKNLNNDLGVSTQSSIFLSSILSAFVCAYYITSTYGECRTLLYIR